MKAKEPKFIVLEKYDITGHCIYSNNKTYMLAWDLSENSLVLLKNKEPVVNFSNLLLVSNGDVSDNGIAIIAGVKNREDKESEILVFNEKGIMLFSRHVKARIYNVGISTDGSFVAFQTFNSMISEEDDNKLFIADIKKQEILSRFHCPLNWADCYQFFDNKIRLFFGRKSIDYSFYGECLENKKIPEEKENPFDVFYDLEEKYSIISEKSKKTDIEDFYQKYLQLSKEKMTPYTYGCIFRRLGELSLYLGDKNNALTYFEKATELYPGIGVKKKILSLKNELG